MERTNRRRIPAAILVAAVLAALTVVLAGTALAAEYDEGDYEIAEMAMIHTDKCGIPNGGETMRIGLPDDWDADDVTCEDYTTPRGLETTITVSTQEFGDIFLNAYFTIDNAFYSLRYSTLEEYRSAENAVNALKEILNAYQ